MSKSTIVRFIANTFATLLLGVLCTLAILSFAGCSKEDLGSGAEAEAEVDGGGDAGTDAGGEAEAEGEVNVCEDCDLTGNWMIDEFSPHFGGVETDCDEPFFNTPPDGIGHTFSIIQGEPIDDGSYPLEGFYGDPLFPCTGQLCTTENADFWFNCMTGDKPSKGGVNITFYGLALDCGLINGYLQVVPGFGDVCDSTFRASRDQ